MRWVRKVDPMPKEPDPKIASYSSQWIDLIHHKSRICTHRAHTLSSSECFPVVCLLEDKLSASLSKRSSMQKPLDKVTLTVRDPLFVVRPLLFYAAIRGMFWVGLCDKLASIVKGL